MGFAEALDMALDPQKVSSPEFREILVTDIAWRFDYGEREEVTLREGDTIDTISEPGWIVLTLQPTDVTYHKDTATVTPRQGFPEVFRYQVSKIISERHQVRLMKVRITAPTAPTSPREADVPLPFADEASGSATGPVGLALADSGVSPTPDTGAPGGLVAPTRRAPRAPRAPRPRRRGSRPGPDAPAD